MTVATVAPRLQTSVANAEQQLAQWLATHSVTALRISLGLVFLGFGILKFFPGMSPAESLAGQTFNILTFGLIPDRVGLMMIAGLETVIGLLLLSGRWTRVALGLLVIQLGGILSPLVLLPGEMFRADPIAPTLAGQYVFKDIILVAAAMVVGARALGARMVVDSPPGDAR
jgi:uncharacterized membrane protein YphA (DoxX/SURF4 family)